MSTGPGSFVVVDLDQSSTDFSAALYGRAGIEFKLANGFTLGVSARYAPHEFDFGDRGSLELDNVQWFATLGARL